MMRVAQRHYCCRAAPTCFCCHSRAAASLGSTVPVWLLPDDQKIFGNEEEYFGKGYVEKSKSLIVGFSNKTIVSIFKQEPLAC